MIHEEVHDRFGDEVLNALPDDVEVGRDKRANQVRLHLLAHREGIAFARSLYRKRGLVQYAISGFEEVDSQLQCAFRGSSYHMQHCSHPSA